VETIQIDVKTIETDVKEAEYQSADSVRLEWHWAVLLKQNIFYPWNTTNYFLPLLKHSYMFCPKNDHLWATNTKS